MKPVFVTNRRQFVRVAAVAGTGLLAISQPTRGADNAKEDEDEISPTEDLMREHGVLKRVLMVYQEAMRRLHANQPIPPGTVTDSAGIIRDFIEGYHEKLEENYLFPRFRKAGKMVELVQVLEQQHQAGRDLTKVILQYAALPSVVNADDRQEFYKAMGQFVSMYNPHEAREDTVLFPAFRKLVSKHEIDSLGEDFEKEEHRLFGEDGFEKMVDRIAEVEKKLDIYDLAKFTPKIQPAK